MRTQQRPWTGGRVKICLASRDGVNVVQVEGPSDEAQALADSAIKLWRFLVNPMKETNETQEADRRTERG